MSGLWFGLALFGLMFGLHVAVWRIRRPLNTAHVLLRGWMGLMILGGLAGPWLSHSAGIPHDWAAHLQGLLLAGALGAGYIATYPALEVTSPTLDILNRVRQAGPQGLDRAGLEQCMDDRVLLHPRIADLLNEGLIEERGGHYVPTAKGVKLAAFFVRLRAILRLCAGG